MIPVILDTDLAGDIDDHWALVMLLGSAELDLLLVTTVSGDTTYRAEVASGLLTAAGRTDVPIGIGLPGSYIKPEDSRVIPEYAERHPLDRYAGTVIEDGVGALIDTVMSSPHPVTIIAIGALTNLAAALEREPRIAENARVVAMYGSVYAGAAPGSAPEREANVIVDIPAGQKVFAADWDIVIAPLDSCGSIVLDGDRYAAVRSAGTPLTEALFEGYREWGTRVSELWSPSGSDEEHEASRRTLAEWFPTRSTILFDTLAVYLAYADDFVTMERLPIAVDDAGMTIIKAGAHDVRVATGWVDKPAFLDHLAERLVVVA